MNERASLGELTDTTVAQPGHIAYIVMDAKAWKEYVAKSLEDKLVPDETALMKWTKIVNNGRPVMAVADTLSEAASVMGVDAKGLEATVRDWNKMVKQGKDTAFGRQITGGIGEGPYYIVEQRPRFATTMGGLCTNDKLNVITKDGKLIPGLYAAGELVGGVMGDDSPAGANVGWALTSGRVAADAIKEAVAK